MPRFNVRSSRRGGLRGMDVIAFVPTTNPARSRSFFETTLGLRLVSEDAFALVFDANGTSIRGMEQDAHGIWTSPSRARIAWFTDPEGNVLSLTQY